MTDPLENSGLQSLLVWNRLPTIHKLKSKFTAIHATNHPNVFVTICEIQGKKNSNSNHHRQYIYTINILGICQYILDRDWRFF